MSLNEESASKPPPGTQQSQHKKITKLITQTKVQYLNNFRASAVMLFCKFDQHKIDCECVDRLQLGNQCGEKQTRLRCAHSLIACMEEMMADGCVCRNFSVIICVCVYFLNVF